MRILIILNISIFLYRWAIFSSDFWMKLCIWLSISKICIVIFFMEYRNFYETPA